MSTIDLHHSSNHNESAEIMPSMNPGNAVQRISSRPTNWVEISTLVVASAILVFEGLNYVFPSQLNPTPPMIKSNDATMVFGVDGHSVTSSGDVAPATDDPAPLPPRRILSIEH